MRNICNAHIHSSLELYLQGEYLNPLVGHESNLGGLNQH